MSTDLAPAQTSSFVGASLRVSADGCMDKRSGMGIVTDRSFHDHCRSDFSKHALQLYSKPSNSIRQMELCLRMLRKPVADAGRFNRVWEQVHALKDAYELR